MPTDLDIAISESGEMVNEHLENNIKCFNGNPLELSMDQELQPLQLQIHNSANRSEKVTIQNEMTYLKGHKGQGAKDKIIKIGKLKLSDENLFV